MPTYTTTYSLGKPVVGADEDAWGDTLNTSLDAIDDILDGTTPVTGIDINSGTLDGVTIGGTTAGAGTFTTLTANTSITGTLATAAQTNITSVGTLTSLDVGGTVTADGLTVDGATGITVRNDAVGANEPKIVFDNDTFAGANHAKLQTGNGGLQLVIESPSTSTFQNRHQIVMNGGGGDDIAFKLSTDNGSTYKTQLYIDNNDISFYEDTGTTAKFFWDASAESLGIGTSSPQRIIHTKSSVPAIRLEDSDVSGLYHEIVGTASGEVQFKVDAGNVQANSDLSFVLDATERMRIDSSGNVGIGTSSPNNLLTLNSNTANTAMTIQSSDTGGSAIVFGDQTDFSRGRIIYDNSDDSMSFETNNLSEAMRIDSSGNVLVGTTNNSPAANNVSGFSVQPSGLIQASRSSYISAIFNRSTDDGDIVQFRKDGTTVGSISSSDSGQTLNLEGGGTSGVRINASNASGYIRFRTAGSEAMRIDSIGNVGIGTSSPTVNLEVANNDQENGATLAITNTYDGSGWNPNDVIGTLEFKVTEGSTTQKVRGAIEVIGTASAATYPAYNDMIFSLASTNGISEKMRITDDGLVGIGTTSPLTGLYSTVNHISGTSGGIILSSSASTFGIGSVAGVLQFYDSTNSSERMRIDSSGNLLVGQTTASSTDVGVSARSNGVLIATADGSNSALFNRKTSDGDIAVFRKDGTTVGSIGSTGGANEVYIANSDSVGLKFTNVDAIVPSTHTGGGANRDAAIDLGYPTVRFKDLYLSGGVFLGGVGAANKLEDYEEGTWTPTVYGHTTTGTTSGTLTGKYTKVGRTVFATAQFAAVSLSSAGGRLYMGGLPYTSVSGAPGGGLVTYLEGFNPAYFYTPDSDSNALSVVVVGSGTYVVFRPTVTQPWDNFVNAATSTWNNGGGSVYGSLQFTYMTT